MGYIALPNGLASRSIPGGYKGGTCRRYGETLNNNSTKLSKVPQRTHAGGGQVELVLGGAYLLLYYLNSVTTRAIPHLV